MTTKPKTIRADQIADVMAEAFTGHEAITCYIGSVISRRFEVKEEEGG